MIIQQVLLNMQKKFTVNVDEYGKCPWDLRFIDKKRIDIWIKGKGKATTPNVCLFSSNCSKCKKSNKEEFALLSKEVQKLNGISRY